MRGLPHMPVGVARPRGAHGQFEVPFQGTVLRGALTRDHAPAMSNGESPELIPVDAIANAMLYA